MIEAIGLGKRYGPHVAIEDVSFAVQKGEVLAFLGPNGAGKTTTMRILTGFMSATAGTARIAGFDIFDHPMEVKRRIGYLAENPPLYREMTVAEYLTFVAKIKGLSGRQVTVALGDVLEKCALGHVAKRLIPNLSRGYKQRVGLAQALVHNPEVLILDEPTTGLDPQQIIEIRQLITSLAGGHTIILSTHILPEATAICQRVVIINKGRVVAVDSQEHLSARVRQTEQISLGVRRPQPDTVSILNTLTGVCRVTPKPMDDNGQVFIVESELGQDIREALSETVYKNGWGLLEMRAITLSLEDVFLHLTMQETGLDPAHVETPEPTETPLA